MPKYIKLYLYFINQNIKTILEYRVDFIVGTLSTFMLQVSSFAFVWIIFQNINTIHGWSFYEITFVYGFFTIVKSLFGVFFGHLWDLGTRIHSGEFDRVLLRPLPTLYFLSANTIHHNNLGETAIGLMIFITSALKLKMSFSLLDIAVLGVFILCGVLIFASIILITATFSFWIIKSKPITWSVFEISSFVQFPLKVYHKAIGIILTWMIPYAFTSFYPATYFLNKEYSSLSILSPLAALVIGYISLMFWKFGIKSYGSTGS